MAYIAEGFRAAIVLLRSFDPELYSIIGLSLLVSGTGTVVASVVFVPIGIYLGTTRFRGKRAFSRLLYTSMSVPTVIIGLVVAILLSRRGPLGKWGLLYTPKAMIIAQTLLLIPLVLGLTYSLAQERGSRIRAICRSLGGNRFDQIWLCMRELKMELAVHVATAFSRAISEVGAVMIVGGNIKGHTRVMTTNISMMNSMGDYPMAIALGVILLLLSFGIHSMIYAFGHREADIPE